ncbi:flavonol 3-O-glucosyltransferase UGT89B1-like [Diospyros lotus]|uniref:flavonol 3-O-glucosyltransferase UGT89B1-like n=1 Tax=Diospyros lotus TaxID=55363 RepID=UPI002253D59D|nr:flavonol 3-O-glucosyltransferase UGT89B1-like [Diospyros lotus]
MSSAAAGSPAHILAFPFSSPGHIIPFLDLTRLFITRGLTVTVLVSPSHVHLLQPMLSSSSSIQPLVLDCFDSFQSASGLPAKIRATARLYDPILHWFRSHPSPPVAILSDMFLGWTQQLASELGVPRLVFWPSGALTASVSNSQWRNLPKNDYPGNENSLISFPEIPNSPTYRWSEITPFCRDFKKGDADYEFLRSGMLANMESWGVVFNSFSELESVYLDHIKKIVGHNRVWAVGPLLPPEERVGPTNRGGSSSIPAYRVKAWLDEKADDSVVYICFGSRVTLPRKQTEVLAAALECSGVHFIWCVKAADEGRVGSEDGGIPDGFEDRVGERGFIIRGWAAQVEILSHRAVGAFVTHCGWNSLLEGLTAGVLMLTWPMGADQFTDAKLLVDQLGVAIRACEGGPQRVPDLAELTRLLAESVSGSRPERSRVAALREAARKAVNANGGSSTKDLEELLKQLGGLIKDGRKINETNY